MDDRLSLCGSSARLPVIPVGFVFNEETYEHAWVHILDVNPSQSSCMAGVDLFSGIGFARWTVW